MAKKKKYLLTFEQEWAACQEAYPTLFGDEELTFIHHTFFVLGCGYHWEDGFLTDQKTHRAKVRLARKSTRSYLNYRIPEMEQEPEVFGERITRAKEELVWLDSPDYPAKIRGRILKEEGWTSFPQFKDCENDLYPICELTNIMHIPDDVEASWLAAADRGVKAVEDGLFKASRSDKALLAKARKRINQLKKQRSL